MYLLNKSRVKQITKPFKLKRIYIKPYFYSQNTMLHCGRITFNGMKAKRARLIQGVMTLSYKT